MAGGYLCVLCTKPINSVSQAVEHNRMKPHQARLRARGLPKDHDVEMYLSKDAAGCPPSPGVPEEGLATGLSYVPKMEVLRQMDARVMIEELRSNGVHIPLGVITVVCVRKVFDFAANKSAFDRDMLISGGVEVCGSVLLMDADERTVLGILCHGEIGQEAADGFCKDGLHLAHLARSSGFVQRSLGKDASAMAMFEHCFSGKDFGRYKHPWEKRQKGEADVPHKRLAQSEELDMCASVFAKGLHECISSVFPSSMEQLEGFYEEREGLGCIGSTPYLTMGISEDYNREPHVNVNDFGFCFILWFLARTSFPGGKNVKGGGEFYLAEYGIYFRPRHGSVLALDWSKVCHGTRQNIGFTQLEIVLVTKKKVADGGAKRRCIVHLGSA